MREGEEEREEERRASGKALAAGNSVDGGACECPARPVVTPVLSPPRTPPGSQDNSLARERGKRGRVPRLGSRGTGGAHRQRARRREMSDGPPLSAAAVRPICAGPRSAAAAPRASLTLAPWPGSKTCPAGACPWLS